MIRIAMLISLLIAAIADAAPTAVIISGDSIAWAKTICPSTPWDGLLETTLKTRNARTKVVNIAKDGTRMDAIRPRWEQLTRALTDSPFPYRAAVIEGGTNDLHTSRSGADVWADMKTQADEAHVAEYIVIVLGVPPRGGSSGWDSTKETERLYVNAQAAAYAVTNSWFHFINTDTLLGGTGSPLALSVTCNSGDALHPSCACQDEIAGAVAAVPGI